MVTKILPEARVLQEEFVAPSCEDGFQKKHGGNPLKRSGVLKGKEKAEHALLGLFSFLHDTCSLHEWEASEVYRMVLRLRQRLDAAQNTKEFKSALNICLEDMKSVILDSKRARVKIEEAREELVLLAKSIGTKAL